MHTCTANKELLGIHLLLHGQGYKLYSIYSSMNKYFFIIQNNFYIWNHTTESLKTKKTSRSCMLSAKKPDSAYFIIIMNKHGHDDFKFVYCSEKTCI